MDPPKNQVVVNQSRIQCFSLSKYAVDWMAREGCEAAIKAKEDGTAEVFSYFFSLPQHRHDPWLVKAVKKLGRQASRERSRLYVVDIYGDRYRIFRNGYVEIALGNKDPQNRFTDFDIHIDQFTITTS